MDAIAPWTDEQVKSLNDWQNDLSVHPYTCANRATRAHWGGLDDGEGILLATNRGWVCPSCDYTQSWAFEFSMYGPDSLPPGWGEKRGLKPALDGSRQWTR